MTITAQCTNPSDMEIEVRAVMSVAQWAQICRRFDVQITGNYYGPLADFRDAIRESIDQIQNRSSISLPWLPPT